MGERERMYSNTFYSTESKRISQSCNGICGLASAVAMRSYDV